MIPSKISSRARRFGPALALAAATVSFAQTPAAPGATAQPEGETVRMSAFEVSTTQGHGYVEGNSAEAFKTSEPLMDIPQSVIVVTNDLIKDIAYENSSDILQYFGLSPGFQGESLKLRGIGITYPYLDDMPDNSVFADASVIDSYEVIKGPTESLYVNSSLAGVVLKNLKHPLPYAFYQLSANYSEWGNLRLTGDFAGPLGNIGSIKLSYRLISVYQHGNTYFDNSADNRAIAVPEIQALYHNTTVILSYDIQDFHSITNGVDYLTPNGNLFTAAGRRFSGQVSSNLIHWEQSMTNLEVLQKLSDTWESRLRAQYWQDHREGPSVAPSREDWGTQTAYLATRKEDNVWKYWTMLLDNNGRYTLGPPSWEMKNIDSFGVAISIWTYRPATWAYPQWGAPANGQALRPGQTTGTIAVPMTRAAFNAVQAPPLLTFLNNPPANQGSRVDTNLYALYWQHSIDVIPNWLRLVAGFTWDSISSQNVTNISAVPWTAAYVPAATWIHRLGAVFHATKDVSLYALDSQSFTPPNSGSIISTGQLAAPGYGRGRELGLKALLLNGRISLDSAWFQMKQSGVIVATGFLPSGQSYGTPVSSRTEGVDGDAAFTIVPGWQLIGSWYAGHSRDYTNSPVSGTFDNSWSVFTRYNFPAGPLRGFALGGGYSQVGGRWFNTNVLLDVPGGAGVGSVDPQPLVKIRQMQQLNGFLAYQVTRNWLVQVNCDNVLDLAFPIGIQSWVNIDPGPPLSWSFQTIYKF